jgi:GntR family transcriptional regulator
MGEWVMISFRIEARSGTAPYQQIVQQVRQALRVGLLREGDQLPTVKQVVAEVAINPNTVLKAYRELEHEGLAAGRPGRGTFITRSLPGSSPETHRSLRRGLDRWLADARRAGLDDESIDALFQVTLRGSAGEGAA